MLPHDLEADELRLPAGTRDSIVLFTGTELRHLRLGYLVQKRFPGLVKQWWATRPRGKKPSNAPAPLLGKLVEAVRLVRAGRFGELTTTVGSKVAKLVPRRRQPPGESPAAVEAEMFGTEVAELGRGAELQPEETEDPNGDAVLRQLGQIRPYFLLTAGGPILRQPVLDCVRGLAVNQHAGWSPELRGARTIEAALYHRELGWVGNTVHLMDTFADAGPILRRSTCTVHADDTVSHCFFASVALGTKLLLELVETALHVDAVPIYAQPARGKTVLAAEMRGEREQLVRNDLATGWLGRELYATRKW